MNNMRASLPTILSFLYLLYYCIMHMCRETLEARLISHETMYPYQQQGPLLFTIAGFVWHQRLCG